MSGARSRIAPVVVLLLVSAALLWLASRVTWLDVNAYNDQSGEAERSLTGAVWQPGLVPLALGALAGVAAASLVRGVAARVVGAVFVLLGLAAGSLLLGTLGEVDTDRVHAAVTSSGDEGGAGSGRTNSGAGSSTADGRTLPEWSEVTRVSPKPTGPALTAAAALALVVAGGMLAARPPTRAGADDRYVTPAARREALAGAEPRETGGAAAGAHRVDPVGSPAGADRGAAPDTGRELWDSLDAGEDPTEDSTR